MKNILKRFKKVIKDLNMEIKFPYNNDEELLKIIKKIAKDKILMKDKYKLGYIISEQSIFITKKNKNIRIYDNYITDITNLKDNIYKQYITINTRDGEKKYVLGFINSKFEGFIASENRYRAKKILDMFLEMYYKDF